MRRVVPPRLDDRTFGQLRAEAIERIQAVCPEWTDFSPSDPGIALAEVFAYLTQTLLYRVNRIPDKQYRAFLELLGVKQLTPSAATTTLVFIRSEKGGPVEIPRGTRVAAENVVFSTTLPVRMSESDKEVKAPAFHGETIDGELVGVGTGAPGLEVSVRRPPIVAPMNDHLDLVVAVEEIEPLPPEARAIRFDGKTFRVWREAPHFAELTPGERAYVVDRLSGVIRFSPAAQVVDERGETRHGEGAYGAVPPQGREIRVSYRTGGGAQGNVRPNTLTTLKDRISGVTVSNPEPATGGRDAESLDNLLVRGPTDFHRLERAVTARDYETLARRTGGIARAKAFTKAEIWKHAQPGLVEIRIVPTMADASHPTLEALRSQETPQELAKVEQALEEAQPLGMESDVAWTCYKPVSIKLEAVVSRQEDRAAVRSRVFERLERLISPLPRSAWDEGWVHGRALRRYDVEGTVRAEPGVLYVNRVELVPDQMPGEVVSLSLDGHQPRTCFAGSANTIYRTLNGGDGWEMVKEFPNEPPDRAETVLMVRASPKHPGHVAAVVQQGTTERRRTYLSRDCGETWAAIESADTATRDMAWSDREGTPLLFFATDKGLQEFLLDGRASPVPVEVGGKWDRGLTSVVASTDARGTTFVAVATNDRTGVYLSRLGGASGSFIALGLTQSVIELAIQRDSVRTFLWAGFADPDAGAARYELGLEAAREGWIEFTAGWGEAGSCLSFGFTRDGKVVAGSHSLGVLWLEPRTGEQWKQPKIECGLPLRGQRVEGEQRLFFPIPTVVVDASTAKPEEDRILAGTKEGVFRAPAADATYEAVTYRPRFPGWLREVVTLPPTWLFCSGRHVVDVKAEDEVGGG